MSVWFVLATSGRLSVALGTRRCRRPGREHRVRRVNVLRTVLATGGRLSGRQGCRRCRRRVTGVALASPSVSVWLEFDTRGRLSVASGRRRCHRRVAGFAVWSPSVSVWLGFTRAVAWALKHPVVVGSGRRHRRSVVVGVGLARVRHQRAVVRPSRTPSLSSSDRGHRRGVARRCQSSSGFDTEDSCRRRWAPVVVEGPGRRHRRPSPSVSVWPVRTRGSCRGVEHRRCRVRCRHRRSVRRCGLARVRHQRAVVRRVGDPSLSLSESQAFPMPSWSTSSWWVGHRQALSRIGDPS